MTQQDDRYAIQRLVLDYALAIDEGDGERVAALFAEGAEIRIFTMRRPEPLAIVSGPTAIVEMVNAIGGSYAATMHVVSNHVLDFGAENTATGVAYCLAHHYYEDDSRTESETLPVRYKDAYSRTPDGWRFARREIHRLWTEFGSAGRRPLTVDLVMAGRVAIGERDTAGTP